MGLTVLEVELRRTELRLRMPFRYGIATMTEAPLLLVCAHAEVDGRRVTGVSSDLLPPKWFTKTPEKPISAELSEMIECIRHAGRAATGLHGGSAFALWRQVWEAQTGWARAGRIPPLLGHFGTSLVERAVIDAACRAANKPFGELLHAGALGLDLGAIHPELRGASPAGLLPVAPLDHIIARHTVGLGDPLTDAEIAPGERLEDGLPQSLAACVRRYGLRHLKIKVAGDVARDRDRLIRIARIVADEARPGFRFTLDGNEQFKSVQEFRAFWEETGRVAALRDFFRHLLFVEQPLHRDCALDEPVGRAFAAWPDRPPMIIDESDATPESLPVALRLGYAGTSHKNCKGVFKGIAHRCLLARRQGRDSRRRLMLSGEDLCSVGPVALLQDLAVMAVLGIESVERNGHHYHPGLSRLPPPVQQHVLAHHGDLYERTAAGWPAVRILDGTLELRSVNFAPFGYASGLPLDGFERLG